ncbi:hypothetical protein EDB92DRAFT_1220513 [Lactarius akahatsu]|uniref:Sodium/calcium exchanger membrane region domain-containing protein n=1 Tax=Lactarius akahatsu TaxID=416441 RepID=A0AAD4LD11_9AGAM|nr:hypothetical protein EDB92DRAFT_1220513 [Lactarius akahatsu]
MDLHRGHFHSIHTHLQVLSFRMVTRIHFLIGAPFRLLTEAHHCWNRLARSPAIRPGLLAAVTTSVLIPVSCSLYFFHANFVTSFTVLVTAIHPLIFLLNIVIDDLAIRYGETVACLLHATTMNAVEVIVAVVGLIRNEPQAVQVSLLGSLIVNTLLIPGLCFFFGGLRLSNQHFNRMIVHSKSPMVMLGLIAFVLPSTLDPVYFVNEKLKLPNAERREATHSNHLADRIISVIMLLTYVGYTVSQLILGKTWRNICAHQSVSFRSDAELHSDRPTPIAVGNSAVNPTDATINSSSPTANSPDEYSSLESSASEEHLGLEIPKISTAIAIISLFGACGLLVVVTVFLDDTLQRITQKPLMSKWFVGFILSPLVLNVPDAIAAVAASINGKPYRDLIISEAQSVQMTFFTIPLITITAWGMGKSFGFSSDLFGSIVLALSTILTLFLKNERDTLPKGVILMSTYLVVATTSWFYPGPSNAAVPNLLTNVHVAHPQQDKYGIIGEG